MQQCMTCRLSVSNCTCGRPPVLGGTGYWERRLEGMTRDLETAVLALSAVRDKYAATEHQLALRIAEQGQYDCPNCGSLMETLVMESSTASGSADFRDARDAAAEKFALAQLRDAHHGMEIDIYGTVWRLQQVWSPLGDVYSGQYVRAFIKNPLEAKVKQAEEARHIQAERASRINVELNEATARIAELEQQLADVRRDVYGPEHK